MKFQKHMKFKNRKQSLFRLQLVLLLVVALGYAVSLYGLRTTEPSDPIDGAFERMEYVSIEGGSAMEQPDAATGQNPAAKDAAGEQSQGAKDAADRQRQGVKNLTADLKNEGQGNGLVRNTGQDDVLPSSEDGALQEQTGKKTDGSGQDGQGGENVSLQGEQKSMVEKDDPASPSTNEDENEPETNQREQISDEGLVTDLRDCLITEEELTEDTLSFYAYYSDVTVASDIRVNYRHEEDEGNGSWLTAKGRDYTVKLSYGENQITIYYTDGSGQRNTLSFTITYQAKRASETEPVVGQEPPVIHTNLDAWSGEISTQNFTFTVHAVTAGGTEIRSDHLLVRQDGEEITNPTGNDIYEYMLYFGKPESGETAEHTVTVLAWDEAGNSRLVQYRVTYRHVEEGQVNGHVRVVVDATTVGVGILADETVEIIQGRPASYTLLAALEQMNFSYDFAGTEMVGFYIRSISRGNAFARAAIPEDLRRLLEEDGMEFREPCTKNKLGEYDFTQGSGWMYRVNDSAYAGKGLSEWYLNDNDTLYLRYTLAFGKDIGGTNSGFGRLENYGGMWIDGGFVPQ